MGVRATVRNGRLTVDQPVDLPEGTVLDLVIDDEGDQLDERQRDALNAAISRSLDESAAGRTAPAEAIIEKLRERRGGKAGSHDSPSGPAHPRDRCVVARPP